MYALFSYLDRFLVRAFPPGVVELILISPPKGTYLDAIYHTSVVIGNSEFYYGQGIQVSVPGQTHHGEPMETMSMGSTTLLDNVIMEYLESMKSIYSPEAYDLFMVRLNQTHSKMKTNCTGSTTVIISPTIFACFLPGGISQRISPHSPKQF